MLLGDLGADVVKLEPPAGDESRTWGPPFWGDPQAGLSAYYAAVSVAALIDSGVVRQA
jgi:CoA:oxalate CoA-transferase